ncbi:MAG: hypothetical protein COA43_03950 [Robiginitomaculum sp.]|nr:MAG: hypothetical protein COA43_03950 [Robiginitomaculum sp.]
MNNSITHQGEMDLGLRSFMLGTYKYMIMAMAVSGVSAILIAKFVLLNEFGGLTPMGRTLTSPMVALGMTFGIIFGFGAVGRKLHTMNISTARMFLFGFAAVMGVWLSTIAAFKDPMISVRIFFMASAMFGGVSLLGYTTKKNLSGLATFASMAFIGVIVLMFANAFFFKAGGGSMFVLGLNAVGLLAVAAITAWETQALKRTYYGTVGDPELAEKYSVYGAASLLLSFINMFMMLMNLFGRD